MRRSLSYSLLLHALVLASFFLFKPQISEHISPGKAIEVESLSEKSFEEKVKAALNKNIKQIAQIDKNLKSEKAPDPKSKERIFYSSHNQRTDRNTKAAKVGSFKNIINPGGKKGDNTKVSKLFELQPDESELKKEEVTIKKHTGRLRSPASSENDGDGESATNDYMEDVAIGAQTILNAKEYRFYGFYSRIREKLLQHWQHRLKAEIYKLDTEGRSIVNTTRKTQVRVYLSSSGQLQNTVILGSSGLTELDRAATDAFKLAAPFPHPPSEMINTDGLVPIRWEFVVVSNDDAGVQFKVERTGSR